MYDDRTRMEKALMNLFEARVQSFMERIADEFGVHTDQLMEIWEETKKKKKVARKKKGISNPRTKTAYQNFSDKYRQELKDQGYSFGEIAKELGRRWKLLTEQEKVKYKNETFTATDQEDEEEREVIPPPPTPPPETSKPQMKKQQDPPEPKKSKKEEPPADMTCPREIEIWNEIRDLRLLDLRTLCEQNGLQTSTKRRDMILALVCHRISEETS